jgi:excisionase family DNA binding protein
VSDAVKPGEAARRLGVSTRTVQRWLRDGRLPAVRVGSHVKVDARALPTDSATGTANAAANQPRKIRRLLVANRGELVIRIARTCRQLGVTCLALVAEDQARAWWTGAADEMVPLEGTYLDGAAVIRAALAAGADAIHPGYGFLAENAEFAQAVIDAGITWVGPPPIAMRALGDKAAARRLAEKVGVGVLAGYDGDDQSDRRLAREAKRIGFPVLAKPSAGGGGKGMHVIERQRDLVETLARGRREAAVAFGDDRLILERYLRRPRHVEVQFLADALGNAVHLGERECSLQRRHQKVIEESPSPAVTPALREKLGTAALTLARTAGYVGAGTAEFLLAPDGEFFFLEVNARLQVEHPVTELVTGRDLVADQLSIAAGEPLAFDQEGVSLTGHAIEARLYAEDADAGFLPATGEVIEVRWPQGAGIRIDAGVGAGDLVGTRYDPLLAKLITHASNRADALATMRDVLDRTTVLGVTTNRGFLGWLLDEPDVRRAEMYTTLIDERWQPSEALSDADWARCAGALSEHLEARGTSLKLGFRLNARRRLAVEIEGEQRSVELEEVGEARVAWAPLDREAVVVDLDGRSLACRLAPPPTVESAVRHAAHEGESGQSVKAPMPGNVLSVRVSEGDIVEAGQVLVVLEAMKMENTIPALAAGRVARVLVKPGQQVERKETLIELV